MKKMLLTPLIVCMVALLSVLFMPAVYATPPTQALGTWTYTPIIKSTREVCGYTIINGEENSKWTETFDGTSYDVFTVVVDSSGFRYVTGIIYFNGKVMDKSGSMVILFVGKGTPHPVTPPPVIWSGQWVILRGTNGLANIRGQGTWWGPPMHVDYSGQIHFG